MGTLRIPLTGLLFCAAALLPLAVIAEEGDSVAYDGTGPAWRQDAQPAQEQDFLSDSLWNIAGQESLLPEQGWDYAGFENVEQYVVVPPQELFRPYEALIEPFFDTQGSNGADWADLTIWNNAESKEDERAWFEFNRVDGTLWAEQRAWEDRQAREQAYIDATLDAEATAWQRKSMDELTEADVQMIQEQGRQDRKDAAAPDPEPVPFLKQLQALFAPFPVPAPPPTFDERFGNFDVDPQYGGLDTDALMMFGENAREIPSAAQPSIMVISPSTQWGFDVSDEERLAAETPPDTSKMLSPSDKNSAYYGWLFGTRIPYLAKEWSNTTLEFLDFRR